VATQALTSGTLITKQHIEEARLIGPANALPYSACETVTEQRNACTQEIQGLAGGEIHGNNNRLAESASTAKNRRAR